MISSNQKTSLLIPSQLPSFIRENPDYANFVLFLQSYYEWMEQNGQVTEQSKNLLNYKDIDTTSTEFVNYFINDFLQYFPQDALISKSTAIKAARQLYKAKGTPSSYEFLFRILYNSDFDVFYTKDSVLKASAGTWYVAKSLKLATLDPNFQNINNLRLFGETTKSIATVENSVKAGTKTEVFISNIERLFQSGEFVRVVDNANQTVLFNGQPLRAKIVGQISQIKIDPNNRGLLYQAGDPVIVYGGLNSANGHGAQASVGTTTSGSIQNINVVNEGFGYTNYPNTILNITNAPGALAYVGSLNPAANSEANVAYVPLDSIALKQYITLGNTNYNFANVAISNANTKLINAFSFLSLQTYPISSVLLVNGGGGIKVPPVVTAESRYQDDNGDYADLISIGMLSPIQIITGGQGYQANDTIVFTGGTGYGAQANVHTVDANGSITSIKYVTDGYHPLGGMGYKSTSLPTLNVSSANVQAYGASLYVPGILGTGATFSVVTDRTGSVTTINLIDPGEDYISTPNVSLKVEDIVVANVSVAHVPQFGDVVYQGTDISVATYSATVNNVTLLQPNGDPTLSLYNLRVFEYNSVPDPTQDLKVVGKNINMAMANTQFNSNYNTNGVRIYGDGRAKANASFLNGLVLSQGQYLDKSGQPSSYDVLQSSNYNNFTYQITVQKEIAKYRDILLNLLHPTGMKALGRYALNSNTKFSSTGYTSLSTAYPLAYYTGSENSYVTMNPNGANSYNNVITFHAMNGVSVLNTIAPNTLISFTTANGNVFTSEVASSNLSANSVTFKDSIWLDITGYNSGILTANANNVLIFGTSIFN